MLASIGRPRFAPGTRYAYTNSWVPGVGIPSDTWGEVWHDAGRDVTIAVLTNREDTASRVWRAIASAYRVLPCS